MKKKSLKKSAFILGTCIIVLSVVIVLINEGLFYFSVLEYLKSATPGAKLDIPGIVVGFVEPLKTLVSGLGFGGVIIVLGSFFGAKYPELPEENTTVSDEHDEEATQEVTEEITL
ncbi:MAG: hypothetical protein RR497_03790 [Oscillospiraceae bacterium]